MEEAKKKRKPREGEAKILVDLPIEVLNKIDARAAAERTNRKNYIERLVISHANKLKAT